jgi:hypothetical protein
LPAPQSSSQHAKLDTVSHLPQSVHQVYEVLAALPSPVATASGTDPGSAISDDALDEAGLPPVPVLEVPKENESPPPPLLQLQ